MNPTTIETTRAARQAHFIRARVPKGGLFANQTWRTGPFPFELERSLVRELEFLGRVLLQFYRAANLLYRQSAAGKQPAWIAQWLDRGKPSELIHLQRSPALKNDLPRVIRPDLLLTESGICVTELDSVPGGIGLTAWLNQTYAQMPAGAQVDRLNAHTGDPPEPASGPASIIGGPDGMLRGFSGIFAGSDRVHVVVSEESAAYRPEMEWLCQELGPDRFQVRAADFEGVADGDAVYRFFELFDLANVPAAGALFEASLRKRIRLTPPPKPLFEEKMLFALLWNRNLRAFWRSELGEAFFQKMQTLTPYTWVVDPAPLPPQAVIPELNLTDWQQLKAFSQRERELIIKASGFSDKAWGARSVYLGSDLSHVDWSAAIDTALSSFERTPYILQRYYKPKVAAADWFDFDRDCPVSMPGRVRLCPYYFVLGEGDAARPSLGGVLATICPADKKIIHGMSEAILVPCAVADGTAHER